jgi:hypothetical protein
VTSKRNGGVSWSHNALQTQDVNGTTRLLRGIIKEVSILSPGVEPAEPLARVAWIGEEHREGSPTAGRRSVRPVVREPAQLRVRNTGQVLGVR